MSNGKIKLRIPFDGIDTQHSPKQQRADSYRWMAALKQQRADLYRRMDIYTNAKPMKPIKHEPPQRVDREERIMPKWDELPNCIKVVTEAILGKGATIAESSLIKSMLPRYAEATVCYIKGRRHSDTLEVAPIIDRIKHRRKIAELHGQTLAIFANDRIDESTKADDLALLAALRNGKTQATQSGNSNKRKRIKHIPHKQALAILERLNCPKDRKTLERWMKGKNTPDDFTPEKMSTVEAFTAWATIYARREQSKINTNNALRIDNPNSRKMQKFR